MIVKEVDLTGKNLSNYKIVSKLGQGGMATVYKAHELSLNRMVALKVLSTQLTEDEAYIKRFQREAQAAARLNHPNIVQVYAIGEEDGIYYFAMEYIKGKSLAHIRQEEVKLEPEKAVTIISQVADALAEAHKAGLVHRDIKPSNIMIDAAGRAKVTDFGIAYVTQAKTKLTKDGSIIGTPEYLSPEQCEGKTVDQRSDIYSLGVTLYELLSGKTPYEADTPVSMLMKIVKGEFPPLQEINPNIPQPLLAIVEKMMQKDTQKRYQHMEEVIQDLDAMRTGKKLPTTMIVEEPVAEREKEPVLVEGRKSNRWAAAIVAAVIVILMGGAFAAKMLIFDKKSSSEAAPAPLLSTQTGETTGQTGQTGQPGETPGTSEQESTSGTDTTLTAEAGQPESGEESASTVSATSSMPATSGTESTGYTGGTAGTTGTTSQIPAATGSGYTAGTTSVSGSRPTAIAKAPIKPVPPAKSCIITPVGHEDKAELVAPYVEEILSKRNYTIIDDPSASSQALADMARSRIVVDVKQTGTTNLSYYGNSSEMYTVRITIKAVDLKTGRTTAGPVSQNVEYTALNANEKLREAVKGLMSRFLPILETQNP